MMVLREAVTLLAILVILSVAYVNRLIDAPRVARALLMLSMAASSVPMAVLAVLAAVMAVVVVRPRPVVVVPAIDTIVVLPLLMPVWYVNDVVLAVANKLCPFQVVWEAIVLTCVANA